MNEPKMSHYETCGICHNRFCSCKKNTWTPREIEEDMALHINDPDTLRMMLIEARQHISELEQEIKTLKGMAEQTSARRDRVECLCGCLLCNKGAHLVCSMCKGTVASLFATQQYVQQEIERRIREIRQADPSVY